MLEDGASFLQKPFTLEELLVKVREVLADRRANRAPGAQR
jgi:DNA-binding response OmpR family regulator